MAGGGRSESPEGAASRRARRVNGRRLVWDHTARLVQRRKLARGVRDGHVWELSPGAWSRRSMRSIMSQLAYVDHDPELAEVVVRA